MSWRDSTIIAPVSVYHLVSYAERYSRYIECFGLIRQKELLQHAVEDSDPLVHRPCRTECRRQLKGGIREGMQMAKDLRLGSFHGLIGQQVRKEVSGLTRQRI